MILADQVIPVIAGNEPGRLIPHDCGAGAAGTMMNGPGPGVACRNLSEVLNAARQARRWR